MDPRAARFLAWPFALAAAALRFASEWWLEPLTWRLTSAPTGLVAWLAVGAAGILVPLGVYLLLTRDARRRPATFEVDRRARRFTAPTAPAWVGPWSIVVGWLTGGLVTLERVPGEDRVRLADTGAVLLVSLVVVALVLVLIGVVLWSDRPRLTLDPQGITVRGLFRRTTVRWDRLVPGGPPGTDARVLVLAELPDPPGPRAVPRTLPVGRAHVDPVFLAGAVHHYVTAAEHRPTIGTPAELDRLRAALAS
ncbi:PH domain-containing protein [Micromonospora coxensis]|uniref:PH domain-containing protein n=1 Tax=Micromonospora coxensis TaxID=356852 RepID=A0A1C5HSS7_9ACTN|nr:PH domain-containing protein [Micromonospora coxensis]SCG48651.1 PH domain-containing protein [Micromonospora coxensis]